MPRRQPIEIVLGPADDGAGVQPRPRLRRCRHIGQARLRLLDQRTGLEGELPVVGRRLLRPHHAGKTKPSNSGSNHRQRPQCRHGNLLKSSKPVYAADSPAPASSLPNYGSLSPRAVTRPRAAGPVIVLISASAAFACAKPEATAPV